ncbi:cytochrome P450 [Thalassoglobus sp. JC818]|uniref:cytochrome P450 family protein n=1 Tax=Thalassoglobus sp. JC818 TaxID=3232136 RepID=UPI003458669F
MDSQRLDLISPQFKNAPHETYRRMREQGDVIRARIPILGKVWVCTTHQACSEMLKDQELFVREPGRAGKRSVVWFLNFLPRRVQELSDNMMSYDGEDHRRLRGLVDKAFQRQSVSKLQPRLTEIASGFVQDLPQHADSSGVVDLIPHLTRPFPLEVISELLGLPEEDRPQFANWGTRLATIRSLPTMLAAGRGIWKLRNYLVEQIDECRANPRPGLLSDLVHVEQDGHRLSSRELIAMAFLLLVAGHETTVHLITGAIFALLNEPEQKAQLLSDWDLATSAVDETLRYVSPIEMSKGRFATRDVEWHGQQLKRGQMIMAMIGSANHDPARFPDPETFDITRSPNLHLSFGSGIHTCLGMQLARAEAATALQRLFTAYPNLQLADPSEPAPWTKRLGIRTLSSLKVRLTD